MDKYKYPDAHNPIPDSDLPTEVIVEGVDYRIDAIVLEKLVKGEPTEQYRELYFGEFLALLENESTIIQGDLVDIIRAKFSKELLAIIQSNNQKLKEIISQADEVILDPSFLESVSEN
ncbi:MAG: hypothetical protein ACRC78_12580 [Planktothrix sp.]